MNIFWSIVIATATVGISSYITHVIDKKATAKSVLSNLKYVPQELEHRWWSLNDLLVADIRENRKGLSDEARLRKVDDRLDENLREISLIYKTIGEYIRTNYNKGYWGKQERAWGMDKEHESQ